MESRARWVFDVVIGASERHRHDMAAVARRLAEKLTPITAGLTYDVCKGSWSDNETTLEHTDCVRLNICLEKSETFDKVETCIRENVQGMDVRMVHAVATRAIARHFAVR